MICKLKQTLVLRIYKYSLLTNGDIGEFNEYILKRAYPYYLKLAVWELKIWRLNQYREKQVHQAKNEGKRKLWWQWRGWSWKWGDWWEIKHGRRINSFQSLTSDWNTTWKKGYKGGTQLYHNCFKGNICSGLTYKWLKHNMAKRIWGRNTTISQCLEGNICSGH